ncbi:MAG: hypothetical protein R6V04_05610 [bacterium]
MNPDNYKKGFLILLTLASILVIVGVYAQVPNSTPADTIQTYPNDTSVYRADYIVIDQDLFYVRDGTYYNATEAIESLLNINATNEWGLVYGTTGDWFNYTELSGATPVYMNLHMHPLNDTIAGEKVIPQVYDKDDTHWQLALYWAGNGTQISGKDCLVMYYAHIEWDNPDGLTYIEANGEEPT